MLSLCSTYKIKGRVKKASLFRRDKWQLEGHSFSLHRKMGITGWDSKPVPLSQLAGTTNLSPCPAAGEVSAEEFFQVFDGWGEVGVEVCFAEAPGRFAVPQIAGAAVMKHGRLSGHCQRVTHRRWNGMDLPRFRGNDWHPIRSRLLNRRRPKLHASRSCHRRHHHDRLYRLVAGQTCPDLDSWGKETSLRH